MNGLKNWKVKNKDFWESIGKKITIRNLWISIRGIKNERQPNGEIK
jgi:hypothetical protein